MIPRIISLRPFISLTIAAAVGVCIFYIQAKNTQIRENNNQYVLFQERNALETITKLPVPLDYNPQSTLELMYRKVRIEGRFLPDHEIYLENRVAENARQSKQKKANGFHIMMPFQLTTGEIVWVNRGWVARDPLNRQAIPSVTTSSTNQIINGYINLTRKDIFSMPNEKPHIVSNKIVALNFYLHDDQKELPSRSVYPFLITQAGMGDDQLIRPEIGYFYMPDHTFDLNAWWVTLFTAIGFWLISGIIQLRKKP